MRRWQTFFFALLAVSALSKVSEQSHFPQATAVYDKANRVQDTDENGVITKYSYDFRGLLTSVTLAAETDKATTTTYAYDELGNEVTQRDANNHATIFAYDALGRRISRTLPDGQSEGYCYDNVKLTGNLLYQTNFNGVVITNQYDFLSGRLTNCSAIGYKVSYAYNATGLRTNMVDMGGTNSYAYNNLSQLTNKTVTLNGGPSLKLNYRYDALGSLTNLYSSTANGVSNVYQFDQLGRMTNVLANGSSVASYGFDGIGNLQSMRYGNGVTNSYRYDARNRLTNLVWNLGANPLAAFGYTVSATGQRTASAETVNGTQRSYQWSYDQLSRMTNEVIGAGSVGYTFDAVGNRKSRTSSILKVLPSTATYTSNDWLTADGYDRNGNTTTSGPTNYQYDVMNHLTNVNNGQIVITYDGDGNRASKTIGGVTTYYLVDDRNPSGYAQVVEEWVYTPYSGFSASLNRVYNYGLALVSERVINQSTSYYGTDGHGSTRFLLNTSGGITDTYAYDAYGILTASTGNTANNYLYCAQQWDSDLGMYYLRARYYKPDTGRFWTFDSYEGSTSDPLSLHKYLYCEANPIMGIDPSGHVGLFKFNRDFGNGAHDVIQLAYQAENPGAIVGSTTGILSLLKPDIFNGIKKTYGDIKPLSMSGVAKGIVQMATYEAMYGVNGYPGMTGLRFEHETWPIGVRGAYVGQIPIAYWNCAGIIFYTDMVDNTEDLLTLATYAACRQFIRANSALMARTLVGAMPRIAILANSRAPIDAARLDAHVGIAALLATLGGF